MSNKKITTVSEEIKENSFRVAIFGSARIKPNTAAYKKVFALAKEIGKHGFDIVTGGGPGLMSAASDGHFEGDKRNKADNIGLTIQLPWEGIDNKHLEIKKHFNKFSARLDNFMALSSAVVVMPGGVGTCLEFFYTWQLVQVKHINPMPIILVGTMWKELIKWVKKYPLKKGLISPMEMESIHIAKDNKEAMQIILKKYQEFSKDNGKHYNGKTYKV